MTTKVDELRDWATSAKGEGLIDVKFYPGSNREGDLGVAAGAALALLKGTTLDEDVTDQEL